MNIKQNKVLKEGWSMTVEKYVIYFDGDENNLRGKRNKYVSSILENGYCYVPSSDTKIKRITPAVAGGQVAWQTTATVLTFGLAAPVWLRTIHHDDDHPYRYSSTNFIRLTGVEWARDNHDSSNSIVVGISGYFYVGSIDTDPNSKPMCVSVRGDFGTADEGWRYADKNDTVYLVSGKIKDETAYKTEVANINEREKQRREAEERERKALKEAEERERKAREDAERERKAREEAEKARIEEKLRNDSFNRRYVELQGRFDDLKKKYDDVAKNSILLKSLCQELYKAAQDAWSDINKTIDTDRKKQLALEIASNCKILCEYDKESLFKSRVENLQELLKQFDGGDYADYANFIFRQSAALTFRGAVPQGNFTSQSSNEDAKEARPQQAFQHRAFSP